ncbi:MAG: GIY-YIG nuclease family protein [Candidatus Latescibacterota bacterium]|nr:MAG: GIY-YIG nuclease family protein [Candidatus Latescibacterota bacterium]
MIRDEVPAGPGVYLFYDVHGNVIYIGKSVNLINRMLSYSRERSTGNESRTRRMVYDIGEFAYYTTNSELVALLLEDGLIKYHSPIFNKRQKEYAEYRYLSLTKDEFPTLKILADPTDLNTDGLFGPFRDRYFVEDLLWVVREHLNLRTCTDPVPFRNSMNYHLGYCVGPCRGMISHEEYAQVVAHVREFLEGDERLIVEKIHMEMGKASARRDYERAATLRDRIRFCGKFCERQRFIHKFKTRNLVILDHGREVYRFSRGWLTEIDDAADSVVKSLLGRPSKPTSNDPRFLLDRANIVYKWIRQQKDGCEYRFDNAPPGVVSRDVGLLKRQP